MLFGNEAIQPVAWLRPLRTTRERFADPDNGTVRRSFSGGSAASVSRVFSIADRDRAAEERDENSDAFQPSSASCSGCHGMLL